MIIDKKLYQEFILEHSRHPSHFGEIPEYTHLQTESNPLCGDKLTLYLKITDDVLEDIGFTGSGCALFKASCSVMTQEVIGKTQQQSLDIIKHFENMILSRNPLSPDQKNILKKLEIFSGVRSYPARFKCVLLGFKTLESALLQKKRQCLLKSEESFNT